MATTESTTYPITTASSTTEQTAISVNAPPEPPPAPPAVDDSGVPWMNRAKEYERKAQEAEQEAEKQRQLNEQYQVALGQLRTQQPAPAQPVTDELDKALAVYQPQDREALKAAFSIAVSRAVAESEKRAEQVGYRMMTDANHSQQLQDQELMAEAQKAFAIIEQNPVWASATRQQKTDRAIAEARAALAAKRAATPTPSPNTLPTTTPGSRNASAPPDKEKWIAEWTKNPENRGVFEQMYRRKFKIDSPEGQKAMREAAEIAWKEEQTPLAYFGPNSVVGKAINNIMSQAKGGGQ